MKPPQLAPIRRKPQLYRPKRPVSSDRPRRFSRSVLLCRVSLCHRPHCFILTRLRRAMCSNNPTRLSWHNAKPHLDFVADDIAAREALMTRIQSLALFLPAIMVLAWACGDSGPPTKKTGAVKASDTFKPRTPIDTEGCAGIRPWRSIQTFSRPRPILPQNGGTHDCK